MPVAPFGRPIDLHAWDRFRSRTGLAVVIDAAAGFDAVAATGTPAVVSLHATKVLGTGEGGFVLCDNRDLVVDIRRRMNFGFRGSREAMVPAFNAKFSEYHAAVGHAALDEWHSARADWLRVSHRYREALQLSSVARLQEGFGETWVSSVCVLGLTGTDANRVERRTTNAAIETRRWWGHGAQAHCSMSACPRAPLPVTGGLSRSTLGVPMFRDLTRRRRRSCHRMSRGELTLEAQNLSTKPSEPLVKSTFPGDWAIGTPRISRSSNVRK